MACSKIEAPARGDGGGTGIGGGARSPVENRLRHVVGRRPALLAAVVITAGCSVYDPALLDGATARDTGTTAPIDAGHPFDAGQPRDGGPTMDGAPRADAGAMDGAATMDAAPIDGAATDAPATDAPPPPADAGIDAFIPMPDAGPTELVLSLANGNEDALQDPPGGSGGPVLLAHSWMSLYSVNHWGALRYQVPDIPRRATIVSATLEVYVDSAAQEDFPNVEIWVDDAGDSVALAAVNDNISSRTRSTVSVVWSESAIGAGWHRTAELRTLVQHAVNHARWAPGNHMMFILRNTPTPTEWFEIRQFDHSAGAYGARLTIQYRM